MTFTIEKYVEYLWPEVKWVMIIIDNMVKNGKLCFCLYLYILTNAESSLKLVCTRADCIQSTYILHYDCYFAVAIQPECSSGRLHP